jgi:hypothetical protein
LLEMFCHSSFARANTPGQSSPLQKNAPIISKFPEFFR